nr:unnamed protein product [Digitaria exilis]
MTEGEGWLFGIAGREEREAAVRAKDLYSSNLFPIRPDNLVAAAAAAKSISALTLQEPDVSSTGKVQSTALTLEEPDVSSSGEDHAHELIGVVKSLWISEGTRKYYHFNFTTRVRSCCFRERPSMKHPENSDAYVAGSMDYYMEFGDDPLTESDDDEETQLAKRRKKFKGHDRVFSKHGEKLSLRGPGGCVLCARGHRARGLDRRLRCAAGRGSHEEKGFFGGERMQRTLAEALVPFYLEAGDTPDAGVDDYGDFVPTMELKRLIPAVDYTK